MEDNPYNRKVLEKLKEIDNSYLSHLKMTGKSVLDSDLVPLVKPNINYEGSGFLDVLGSVAPLAMLALGKPKKGGKRGRPSKKQMEAGGILSGLLGSIGLGKEMDINYEGAGALSGILGMMGLGKEMEGGIIKTAGNVGGLNARAIGSGKAEMEGSGLFDVAGSIHKKKQRGRPRKLRGGDIGVQAMAEQPNLLTGGKKRGRKSKKQMEAGGFFDDIVSSVGNAVKTVADVAPSALALAKMIKGGAKSGGAKKSSPWIAHVKAYAKKHKMKYSECLKDPGCRAAYKK